MKTGSPAPQQPRADGEVLVVGTRDAGAVLVGGGDAARVAAVRGARCGVGVHAASAPGRAYSRRPFRTPVKTNSPAKSGGGSPPASPPQLRRSYASTSMNVRPASTAATPASDTASIPR